MAIIITDDCINCGACEPECPNNAIYDVGQEWSYSDGTTLSGNVALTDGRVVDADEMNPALSLDYHFIVPDKCTECVGFHDEPQCKTVCPVDCCIDDPDRRESESVLEERKELLHA